MATPQWVLVQRRLQLKEKSVESQFERNALRRQREAVRSAMRKGFLKILNQKLILKTAKESDPSIQDLDEVKFICLSPHAVQHIDNLGILSCTNLQIVNLSQSYVSDISAFGSCVNLLKLDVSRNQIEGLPDSSFWSSLTSLKILYLHGNLIKSKECLLNLSSSPQLQILTMYDNPVSFISNYRHIVVNCIVTLKAVDRHVISDEEIIENFHPWGKFKLLARSFKMPLYITVDTSSYSHKEDMSAVHKMLLSVDIVLAHYSPVIIIQRWVRGWLVRKAMKSDNSNKKMRAVVQTKQASVETLTVPNKPKTSGKLPHPPPPTPISPATRMYSPQPSPLSTKEHHLPLSQSWGGRENKDEVKKILQRANLLLQKQEKINVKKVLKKSTKLPTLVLKKEQEKAQSDTVSASNNNNNNNNDLNICGQHQNVTVIDKIAEHILTNKTNGMEVREAEKQIKNIVTEQRQAPEVDKTLAKPKISKDMFAFTRGHVTVSLAALKQLDKIHKEKIRAESLLQKANLVCKVRQERENRRVKLYEHQQTMRDAINAWRMEEELKMERSRQRAFERHQLKTAKKSQDIEKMKLIVEKRVLAEKLACNFRLQQTKLEDELNRETKRLQEEASQEDIQDYVRELKETAQEHNEVVKQFMLSREEKLQRDAAKARHQLNATMMQRASQQLYEAKQKVAREIARKKAAKEVLPGSLLEEVPPTDLNDTLGTIPRAAIETNALVGPLLRACGNDVGETSSAPGHMRGMSREAYWTWQRGTHVMKDGRGLHFPELSYLSDDSPLMYDMLHPLPILHNVGTTPANSLQNTMAATPINETHPELLSYKEWTSRLVGQS